MPAVKELVKPIGLERKAAALRALRYEGSEQQWLDLTVDFAISVGIDPWRGFQTATTTRPGPIQSNRDRTYEVCYWSDWGRKVVREVTGFMNGNQVTDGIARKLNWELQNRLRVCVVGGTARPPHMKGVSVKRLLKKATA